jgi:hypothetical protein
MTTPRPMAESKAHVSVANRTPQTASNPRRRDPAIDALDTIMNVGPGLAAARS